MAADTVYIATETFHTEIVPATEEKSAVEFKAIAGKTRVTEDHAARVACPDYWEVEGTQPIAADPSVPQEPVRRGPGRPPKGQAETRA